MRIILTLLAIGLILPEASAFGRRRRAEPVYCQPQAYYPVSTASTGPVTDAMSEGAVGVRGTKTSFSGRGARLHSSEPSRRPLRVLVFSKHEKCVEMTTVREH